MCRAVRLTRCSSAGPSLASDVPGSGGRGVTGRWAARARSGSTSRRPNGSTPRAAPSARVEAARRQSRSRLASRYKPPRDGGPQTRVMTRPETLARTVTNLVV